MREFELIEWLVLIESCSPFIQEEGGGGLTLKAVCTCCGKPTLAKLTHGKTTDKKGHSLKLTHAYEWQISANNSTTRYSAINRDQIIGRFGGYNST